MAVPKKRTSKTKTKIKKSLWKKKAKNEVNKILSKIKRISIFKNKILEFQNFKQVPAKNSP